MTRLLAWANVNQLFMALNNTGDERHAREGNMGSVISLNPDWEACRVIIVRQEKNSSLSISRGSTNDGHN
jgi:hypothetical protein